MQTAQLESLQLNGRQTHLWNDFAASFPTERELAGVALLLGAGLVGPWSDAEKALARSAADADRSAVSS